MPYKPKKPCAFPGCPELTNQRYCPEHQKIENKRYEMYQRDPNTRHRYGRAWKRIRDSYIKQHPLCEQCLSEGRYVPAQQVHHILPLTEGGTHDRDNLMSLCTSCHTRIHDKMGDRFHHRQES